MYDLESRLVRLECSNRRLRWAAAIMVIVAASAGIMGFGDGVQDLIKTRGIIVVSKSGESLITLTADDTTGYVIVSNAYHKGTVMLSAGEGGGMMGVSNERGYPTVIVAHKPSGDGAIQLRSTTGKSKWLESTSE